MKTKKIMPGVLIGILVICTLIPASLAAESINFTATLIAEDTWIPPEGIIDFTVQIENTGAAGIDRFEIITPDAILVAEYGGLPAGQRASVAVHPIVFDDPGVYPVELFVVGYSGGDSLTRHTNELTVTVSSDPEPTPTPDPTETPAAAPETTPGPTIAEASETTPEPSAEPTAVPDAAAAAPEEDHTLMYIIIAVLGVLAAAVVVTVIVIAGKRNKTK